MNFIKCFLIKHSLHLLRLSYVCFSLYSLKVVYYISWFLKIKIHLYFWVIYISIELFKFQILGEFPFSFCYWLLILIQWDWKLCIILLILNAVIFVLWLSICFIGRICWMHIDKTTCTDKCILLQLVTGLGWELLADRFFIFFFYAF